MARELKPCPFCGDPMEWNHDVDGFMHTPRSTDIGKCYLRHTYYHRGQLDWWNTRTDQPPPNTDLTDVEQEARFLCERLRDLEGNIFDDEVGTEYYGHVAPSRARLELLLADRTALDTENSEDHMSREG